MDVAADPSAAAAAFHGMGMACKRLAEVAKRSCATRWHGPTLAHTNNGIFIVRMEWRKTVVPMGMRMRACMWAGAISCDSHNGPCFSDILHAVLPVVRPSCLIRT